MSLCSSRQVHTPNTRTGGFTSVSLSLRVGFGLRVTVLTGPEKDVLVSDVSVRG
jgi:hypothetical protein